MRNFTSTFLFFLVKTPHLNSPFEKRLLPGGVPPLLRSPRMSSLSPPFSCFPVKNTEGEA